jgi:hypothetical protein
MERDKLMKVVPRRLFATSSFAKLRNDITPEVITAAVP